MYWPPVVPIVDRDLVFGEGHGRYVLCLACEELGFWKSYDQGPAATSLQYHGAVVQEILKSLSVHKIGSVNLLYNKHNRHLKFQKDTYIIATCFYIY